jgi:SH3-like domain-containing protein
MNKLWMCAAVLALSAAAAAQDEAKSSQEKVAFEKKAYPFEGVVTAERLNVRLFPKTDATSIIASVLALGETVTVVGERDDFFQVLPTHGCTAWISAKNVKREGAAGTVTATGVPVRMDSRVGADTLCTLEEEAAVKIVGEHLGWLKIEAPAAIKYFVSRKYIRIGKEVDVKDLPDEAKPAAKAVEPAPRADGDADARAKMSEADDLLAVQMRLINARELDSVDFAGVVTALEAAAALAKDPFLRAEAERDHKRYRDMQVAWSVFKEEKRDREGILVELKKQLEPKKEEKKPFAMMGYIDTTGAVLFKRPGTHKLVMGGKIVCFLRAQTGDEKMINRLNDLYQRYVGVTGEVIKSPEGWDGYSVVIIDEVVPITKE